MVSAEKTKTSTIKLNESGYTGYLAVPEHPNGSGILLIQEIFGVNSHIRSVADLYAQAGYLVLAPDVFWRSQPGLQLGYEGEDFQKGLDIAMKMDPAQAAEDMKAAIDKLRSLPECKGKVAAVGYCMGGKFAYVLACKGMVDAAVSYYGGGISQELDMAKDVKVPVIMHFGEKDSHIPMSDVQKIEQAVKGKDVTIYVYDADHGFNCDARKSYDRPSAMLAFARSLQFLEDKLG